MNLIERAIGRLRCPTCFADSLEMRHTGLLCANCESLYPIEGEIVDFCPDYAHSQNRTQRAMENPFMAKVYEDYWRPWFTWLSSPVTYAEEKDWLLAQHERSPVECVLDVGTGTGRYARILADAYHPELVIALDLSMPMLDRGYHRARKRGHENILFVRGDAQRLPVRDRSVDLLNCFGALHLFPDADRALNEMARSAKPGTIFSCLTVAQLAAPPKTIRQKLFARGAPLRLFAINELQAKLATAGFENFDYSQRGFVLLFTARTPQGN